MQEELAFIFDFKWIAKMPIFSFLNIVSKRWLRNEGNTFLNSLLSKIVNQVVLYIYIVYMQ